MARLFTDVLGELSRGNTVMDLTSKLSELVVAVQETKKAGTITLVMKVTPNGEDTVFVKADTKVKLPEPAHAETIFFTTSGGSLSRDTPAEQNHRGPVLAAAAGS